jgi:glycosyltransferase involved in cell wall biosynthesis
MRVLLIARYRDATMQRKVDYLAQAPDVELCHILPAHWRDELLDVRQVSAQGRYTQLAIPMIGKPSDPHRAFYRTLTFHMRQFRPDIIHAEEEPDSLSALQIAWAKRVWRPDARLLLHTWQNLDRPKSRSVRWVISQTLRAAYLVFSANREAATLLRRYGFQGETPVIPAIGVDTETFRPCPPDQANGHTNASATPFTIGYIGRLVAEKGIDVLLRAVAVVHTAHADLPMRLQLIGEGPQRQELQELASTLGIADQLDFLGAQPPARVAALLCNFNVVVLPSRTTPVWKEQLGRALLEAMACGIPVIGSDSGAIPEVIGDAGLVVPEGDVTALAEAIARLSVLPELRNDLGKRGRARVEAHYSQRHLAEQTLAVYRQVVA